jgi:gluconolactonase
MTTVDGFDIRESEFKNILNKDSLVEYIATGFAFVEGPLWKDNGLLFSDIPNNRIVHHSISEEGPNISTFRYPSGNSNGLTMDLDGNLIACEHSTRRISLTTLSGETLPIATRYREKRLNSPNDVVVKSDGFIYFTDPPYGLPQMKQGKELAFNGVYRVKPNGKDLELLIDDIDMPNGIAFSPDEKHLYVTDSMHKFINIYALDSEGRPKGMKRFANLDIGQDGTADGIKVDTDGRVYSTGPGGIWVFATSDKLEAGKLLGKILLPEIPANCAWGEDGSTLFITARTGLYKIRLAVMGTPVGPR